MQRDALIFVAGHRGMVGSALVRALRAEQYLNLLTASREDLDLRDQLAVRDFFEDKRPQYVLLAAARVGGIAANSSEPVEFLYDNLMIQSNVIRAAAATGVEKLLFLGSSCIYPRLAPQPLKEEYLLTGPLEPTNESYAVAKIAGIKLCQAYQQQYGRKFISAMPTNLYGPGDNFDARRSHVLAAFIQKFHDARVHSDSKITLWGTGRPRREFLHVDDLAQACLFLMREYDGPGPINIGCGKDISIAALADLMREISSFEGEIVWDSAMPDGTPRKLLDVSKMTNLGWTSSIPLREGLEQTYAWFAAQAGLV